MPDLGLCKNPNFCATLPQKEGVPTPKTSGIFWAPGWSSRLTQTDGSWGFVRTGSCRFPKGTGIHNRLSYFLFLFFPRTGSLAAVGAVPKAEAISGMAAWQDMGWRWLGQGKPVQECVADCRQPLLCLWEDPKSPQAPKQPIPGTLRTAETPQLTAPHPTLGHSKGFPNTHWVNAAGSYPHEVFLCFACFPRKPLSILQLPRVREQLLHIHLRAGCSGLGRRLPAGLGLWHRSTRG